jgi:hypothetical protein
MLHLLNKNKTNDNKKNDFQDAVSENLSVSAMGVVASVSLEMVGGGGSESGPVEPTR